MRNRLTALSGKFVLATAAMLLAGPVLSTTPAAAQGFWWEEQPSSRSYKRYRKRTTTTVSRHRETSDTRRRAERKPAAEDTAAKAPAAVKAKPITAAAANVPALQSQLLTVVTISSQKVDVYDSNGAVDHGSVSTGQAGHRTPTGIFSIIQKNRYHHSNIYSGAPMPFMQRITWSGVAMHQGVLPGYPASHGCIRLSHSFATAHFGRTKVGMRVVVSPEPATIAQIDGVKLPQPLFQVPPAGAGDPLVRSGSLGAGASQPVKIASIDDKETGGVGPPLTSPMERAAAAKARATADVAIKADAAKVALQKAADASAAAGEAQAQIREAEARHAEAAAEVEMVSQALANATETDVQEKLRVTKLASEGRLAEAYSLMMAARHNEETRRTEAFAAAAAAREAEKASDQAVETAKAARRWTEPVSVFVSKKEGRVYARQGFAPIFEAPVEIKNPDLPIGTHLYVAMDSPDGGKTLAWKAVTVPNKGVTPAKASSRGKKKQDDDDDARHERPRETAVGALDRVVFPPELVQLLGEKLWPGASIIISDYGTSNEQSETAHTDFIVLTR